MTERSPFPRTLLVLPGRMTTRGGAGGLLISSLFRGWPPERLAQVFTTDLPADTPPPCDAEYRVDYREVPGPANTPRFLVGQIREAALFAVGRRETLEYVLRLKNLLDWCRRFSPEVIYAYAFGRPPYYWHLGRTLAKRLNVPYITHVMDDWPGRYALRRGWLHRLAFIPRMKRDLAGFFSGAAANLAICSDMAAAYHRRYGGRFQVCRNGIEPDRWRRLEPRHESPGAFTIVYAGSAMVEKELDSLKDAARAVSRLRAAGRDVVLTLYSSEVWRPIMERHLVDPPAVVHGGFVPDLPKVLASADLLLLPLNFDAASRAYTGLSFQTKLPEYMASATPVLVYGPASNPSVRYAAAGGWARCVTRRSVERLRRAIEEIMADPEPERRQGRRARRLALAEHDAGRTRMRFQRLVRDVAQRGVHP